LAVRKKYQDGGYAKKRAVGGLGHTNDQGGPGNIASTSIQGSFAALNVADASTSMVGRQKLSKQSKHLMTDVKPRHFTKGSQKGRQIQHSRRGSRISNGNNHNDSNKLRHPVPSRPVPQNAHRVGGPPQQTSGGLMEAQHNNLPQNPIMQPGFHYNSFGAAIPRFVAQDVSNMVAQGPTQPNIQIHQPASNMTSQSFARPAAQVHRSLNIPGQGFAQPLLQLHHHGNHVSAQQVPNIATQNFGSPMPQMSRTVVPFNPQPGAWNIAGHYPSQIISHGPPLPAVPAFQHSFSLGPHVGAQNAPSSYNSLMAAQNANLAPNPDYYGPTTTMSNSLKDLIMAANGIKLPATFIPDARLYNGPLLFLKTPIANEIMAATEAAQNPAFPFYRPRGHLAHMTMLQPVALPRDCYHRRMSPMEIHAMEIIRHTELMQEVLAIPGDPKLKEEKMKWFRLLGERDPNTRRGPVSWHPQVIDLYGRKSQYEQLLIQDVNHRNSNEKGVGRRDAPVNRRAQTGSLVRAGTVSQESVHHAANIGFGAGFQRVPAMMHARQDSDDTSVFFKEQRTPPASRNYPEYLGYRMRVKRHEDPSPEVSPTPPSRKLGTQVYAGKAPLNFSRSHSDTQGQKRGVPSASTPLKPKKSYAGSCEEEEEPSATKTPLLNFDKRYTEMYGEGDDTDFAVRDMGPPRIGGKTFNEAIGFTPTKTATESPASLFYPMNVLRKHRD